MKPAAFDYVRADSVGHAVEALAQARSEAKIIAGGQSLMPMMNFRLVKPSVLVDINRIPDLDTVEVRGDRVRIGALVRHRMTASDPVIRQELPVVHEAMKNVAHMTVRNRGTFCGSVCHADPAAEMPMMTLLLDGVIHIVSPRGERTLEAQEFLAAALSPPLDPDEMVVGIELKRLLRGTGWAFEEFARRHGDYALASVAATVERRGGLASNVRVALMGVADMSSRLPEVEAVLEGSDMSPAAIDEAVGVLRRTVVPKSDLSASADYRRHLGGALGSRVLSAAWARAGEGVAA
jgi:carbon-monoxide dehydrogenase medium subunit